MGWVQWTLLAVYLLGIPPSAYFLIWLDTNHDRPMPVLSLLLSSLWPIIIPIALIVEAVVTLSWAMHESAKEGRFGRSRSGRRLSESRPESRGGRPEK